MKFIMKNKINLTGCALSGLVFMQMLTVACSKPGFNSANLEKSILPVSIVNGQLVKEDNLQPAEIANPVVAIVNIDSTGAESMCTGTLIAPKIVLTAAHCVEGETKDSKIYIFFQTLDEKKLTKGNVFLAKKIVIHPNYIQAKENKKADQADDLALILLPFSAPESVQPATLATPDINLASLGTLTDVGFGQADDRANATDKQAGIMRYLEYSSQNMTTYQGDGFFKGMIIAEATQAAFCHGDSGGPLFAGSLNSSNKVIVGIVDMVFPLYSGQQKIDYEEAMKSADMKSFYQKYPDAHICLGLNVFVEVSSHLDWINQNAKSLASN